MNLVLRQGALKDGEGYTFTLHITDLTTGEEGYASIDLFPNQPPIGGLCRLSPKGTVRALMAKVHFECAGETVVGAVPEVGLASPLFIRACISRTKRVTQLHPSAPWPHRILALYPQFQS